MKVILKLHIGYRSGRLDAEPVSTGFSNVLWLTLALLTSCAAVAPPTAPPPSAPAPGWPAPPAPARIHYLRSIRGPQDWGLTPSLWQRLVQTITGDGGALFVRPSAVAEQGGVLYVADPGAHALWIFDAPQNQVHKISHLGDEELASPVALALRPDGAVFLSDARMQKVFLLDRSGQLIRVAANGLARPVGLAYNPVNQRLYVADSTGQKISVFGPDGKALLSWGQPGSGDGQFNYPTHLALDASGNLLINDALNFRLQAFGADGRFLWKFGRHGDGSGDFASPKGVATDGAGHIFVVDALFDAVQVFDRDGSYLLGVGERGEQNGQFWLPGGLFINAKHEIFVADSYNRRIQVLVEDAVVTKETPQ